MAPAQALPFIEEDDDNEEVETLELETSSSSYHPSAPSSEIFDMRTTVGPSYIVSLIQKLLPHSVKNAYSFHGDNDCNAFVGKLEIGIRDTVQASSPGVLTITNNTAEVMDTHDETTQTSEHAHQRERTDDSFGGTKDNNISTIDEASWEECGCILWDLSVNKTHAVFMVENLLLEVLLSSLAISQSLRVTEIGLGILANIACHEVLRNRMISMPGLIDTIVDQLFLDDSLCLSEAFRLLSLGLQGSDSVTWANALQPEHILRRILWVVENTLNPRLLEKGISLLLAIIENQQEVAQTLLQSLMKLGLPSLLVSLLACEMKHLFGERVPDRYSALDTLLRLLEAPSVLDNHSEVISSSEELLRLIYNLIKLPDKFEVSSSCITAVVLIANVMTDKPDLASEASQDLSLLQGLLSLLPFVSNDLEARNALWSILGRVLVRVQEDEMSPSSLHQYVRVLVNKSDFIEEDLIDHRDEDSNEYHQNSNISFVKETARTTSLSRISSILQRWITIGENIVKKDTVGEVCADHENVKKLLHCCRNYTM